MNARAESDVLVRPAGDIELVRVFEHVGVAIGRGNEPADTVVLFQQLAPHLDILRGDSLDRFHWRIVAQTLLGRQFGCPGRVLFFSSAHCSGCWMKASVPLHKRLMVVSWPAINRSEVLTST